MMNLPPLVVANYEVRPSKGGRRFGGFKDEEIIISVCEVLFRHVATAGFDAASIAKMFEIREIDVPALMEANGVDSLGTRKLRFLPSPKAWTPIQVNYLMMLWHCQLTVGAIADYIGRSPGSVRYKARSLGLPTRPRETLVLQRPNLLPPLAPLHYRSWNNGDDCRLGEEHLRGINPWATAWRMRRDYRHTQWTLARLQLPGRSAYRNKLTKTVFDPNEPMLEEYRKAGWTFKFCVVTKNPFWGPKNGPRICNEFKRTKTYRDMVASGVLAYD